MKTFKIKYLKITILILICLNTLSIINIITLKNQSKIKENEKEREKEKVIVRNRSLISDQLRYYIFNQHELSENISIMKISDFDKNSINLGNLNLKQPKIVFRFTDLSCDSCVNQELKNLELVSKELGTDRIVVLGSFESVRDAIAFGKLHNLEKFEFYLIDYDAFGDEFEKEHLPVLFILKQSLKILDPFFPRYDLPQLSNNYYEVIKTKYFTKKL